MLTFEEQGFFFAKKKHAFIIENLEDQKRTNNITKTIHYPKTHKLQASALWYIHLKYVHIFLCVCMCVHMCTHTHACFILYTHGFKVFFPLHTVMEISPICR